jgi:hypothetical protein
MTTWIEYSLLFLNGQGTQPYETLAALGAHFDGGYYTETGRYRGRLTCDADRLADIVASLSIFGARILTTDELLTIVERVQPINSVTMEVPNDTDVLYLGPASLDDELRVVRPTSPTPF